MNRADPGSPPRARRVIGLVVGAMVLTSMPVFLTGALSPLLGRDLAIAGTGTGVAIAAFFVAGACAALPVGRLVDRIGSATALRVAGAGTAVVCGLIGAAVGSFPWLVAVMVVGGVVLAFADTGAARALATAVPPGHQGLAFGSKEASIPLASLLAGLAVPLLGQQLGWRSAYLLAAGAGLLLAVVVPRGLERGVPPAPAAPAAVMTSGAPTPGRGGVRPLVLLAVGAALAGAGAASIATFLVPSLAASGLSLSAAGLVLSVASLLAVGTRLSVGALADRVPASELRTITVLTLLGAVGSAGLALGTGLGTGLGGGAGAVLLVLAACVALGGGWGWTGLVFLAAVRLDPSRPAVAASAVLVGLGGGGSLGPALAGVLADRAGYVLVWSLAAVAMALATAVLTFTRRGLQRASVG